VVGRGWEVRSKRKRFLVVAMMISPYVAAEAFALRGWWRAEGGGWRVKVRAALGMGSGAVRYGMRCDAMLEGDAMGVLGAGGGGGQVVNGHGGERASERCGVMSEVG
jgi:hypothetical protein